MDFEQQEEELRLAQIRLDRAAERDHELRSGLSGLVGAIRIMGADAVDTETTTLGSAVAAELSRLDDLLQRSTNSGRNGSTMTSYAVAPVLAGLVALRSLSGMDVGLDVEPGLRTQGSSETLAEVITNLLDNAAHHAPGSPVQIAALQESGHVVVRVATVPAFSPVRRQRCSIAVSVIGGRGAPVWACPSAVTCWPLTAELSRSAPRLPTVRGAPSSCDYQAR